MLLVLSCLAASAPETFASTATSSGSSTIGASVLPSTSLSTAGCPHSTSATNFGPVSVSSSNVTSTACRITFGSSNSTSSLRIRQTDARDTAMVSVGATSAVRRSATIGSLVDVAAGGGGSIWAVGPNGLAASHDDGANWTYPAAGVTVALTGVTAWSATGAVAVGASGRIRRTEDGSSWSPVDSPFPSASFSAVDSTGPGAIYAIAQSGIVVHSDDGGETFTDRSIAPLTTATVTAIDVIDDDVAWATAGSNVYRTTDAGLTWELRYAGCAPVLRFVATSETEALGLVYGGSGCPGVPYRVRTTNGGDTWTTHSGYHGTNSWIRGYALVQPGTIIAYAGGTQAIVHEYYISTNGGVTFSANASPPGRSLTGIQAMDAITPTKWITVGELATITATDDGGATWSHQYAGADRALTAIDRSPDGSEYWAVGEQGRVLRSTNDGASWTTLAHASTSNLHDVVALGNGDAVAVGDGGAIYRTDDEGATWSSPASQTSNDLLGVARVGQTSTLFAAGASGTIRRSTDLGETWSTIASGTGTRLNDITSDGVDVWAVGNTGLIRRSSDDGASWSTVSDAAVGTTNLLSAHAPRRDVVWIGARGKIARTSDGGTTWLVTSPSSRDMVGIYGLSEVEAVAVDNYTSLHRTWDGGTTWASLSGFSRDVVSIASGRFLTVTAQAQVREWSPQFPIADYASGVNGWADADSMFGACLDSVDHDAFTNGTSWTPNPGCAPNDLGSWYSIGATSATVAHAPTGTTTATADLYFGMRVSGNQRSGRYVAPITFEVFAPSL